jgi:hypothetical protein
MGVKSGLRHCSAEAKNLGVFFTEKLSVTERYQSSKRNGKANQGNIQTPVNKNFYFEKEGENDKDKQTERQKERKKRKREK